MADKSDEEVPPPCTKEASTIQAIDKKSVHRICSGQVVLTLSTAVKELVENSIDAGATNVEVKLKEYGSESVEVSDNGCGIEEKNFEGITLKHHTSKLQDFEDLINVSTFGFRGEALSSLCALSNMAVITRHKSVNVGTRLGFDVNGKITEKKSTPRQVGTTVTIQNVFYTLPVRYKEFHRNLKKEFARLVQVLNAYCIINTGVRISCINQTSKGSRSTVVATNGNTTMRDNITNVFGPKQFSSLLEFKQVEAKDEICSEFGIKLQSQSSLKFKIDGFVSKCEHGQGRSSSDRQFLFINKRPCDAAKIFKVINEVYHSYNRHQNPFIALHIQMDKDCVDVNVTPDKRQIFVDGEKVLLAVLKASLIEIFEPTTAVYKLNNTFSPSVSLSFSTSTPTTQKCSSLSGSSPSSVSLSNSLSILKRSFSSAFDKNKDSPSTPVSLKNSKKSNSFPYSSTSSSMRDRLSRPDINANSMLKFVSSFSHKSFTDEDKESVEADQNQTWPESDTNMEIENKDENIDAQENECVAENKEKKCDILGEKFHVIDVEEKVNDVEVFTSSTSINIANDSSFLEHVDETDGSAHITENRTLTSASDLRKITDERLHITDRDIKEDRVECAKKEVTVKFSLENLKQRAQRKSENSKSSSFARSFRAKICPGDNQSAEEELSREISKDKFAKMKILGQFNLGFIITQSGSDLFIVDQHATDEKYNFEMLQRNTVLQSQRLIVPQSLELTASNETILIDNLEIFKKNGFNFIIEPNAPPTQRVKLVSAPISKNWNFGKEDIEELLFMLTDSPDVMCRPSRVRLMFASRACRKSIMIGTALNHPEMKRVVTHMGEMEQPWNCPHGRPTMRHLFNMNMLPT